MVSVSITVGIFQAHGFQIRNEVVLFLEILSKAPANISKALALWQLFSSLLTHDTHQSGTRADKLPTFNVLSILHLPARVSKWRQEGFDSRR